jgi:hypothetical protein
MAVILSNRRNLQERNADQIELFVIVIDAAVKYDLKPTSSKVAFKHRRVADVKASASGRPHSMNKTINGGDDIDGNSSN